MQHTVGITMMKLDRISRSEAKGRTGYNLAVTQEALAERYASDEDLDKSETVNNIYWLNDDLRDNKFFNFENTGRVYGSEITAYWNNKVSESKLIDKKGQEKTRRKDTLNGFAGIIKPPIELMDKLTEEQQIKFLEDSLETMIKLVEKKKGCKIDCAVIHLDEGNPHLHFFGHDEEYRLTKKLFNLSFYRQLNESGYPKLMRDKGWSMVADADCYDAEAVKNMTDEEKEEYHEKRIKKRKNSGRKSAEYKLAKDLEKKRAATDKAYEKASEYQKQSKEIKDNCELKLAVIEQREKDVRMHEDDFQKEKEKFGRYVKHVKKKEDSLNDYEDSLKAYEKKLKARESNLQAAYDKKEKDLQNDYDSLLESLVRGTSELQNKLHEEYQAKLNKLEDLNLKKQLEASESEDMKTTKAAIDRIRRTNFQRGYEINNIDLQNSTEIDKEYE